MENCRWIAVVVVLAMIGFSLPATVQDQSAAAVLVGESEMPPLRMPSGFFTENAGQVDNEQVRFYSTGDMQVGFAESAVLLKLVEQDHARIFSTLEDGMSGQQVQREDTPSVRGVMVRISFDGSNKVNPRGVQEMPHRSNYFIGNDPAKWRTGVRSYQEIVYRDLYDGIDLSYTIQDGQLKYEFILDPGADPALITVSYEGIEDFHIDQFGELVINTTLGELRDGKPISYQDEKAVECALVQRGSLSFGYRCEGRDPSRALVIDPLIYSTFLGGSDYDLGFDIAVDSSGSPYVIGWTFSADFPATSGSFDTTYNGTEDTFVARLNASGSGLVYATYLGGGLDDRGYDITVDTSGSAYVTGGTFSGDFPAKSGSFDTTFNGSIDAFVAKLDATGSALIYSTFLGGGDVDWSLGIAIDSSGSAYATGPTASADFPATPGSIDTTYNGGDHDVFVAKLNASGSALVYATFLGGNLDDRGSSIAVDSFGGAFVTGWTHSADFPATPGSFDTTHNGAADDDAFIAKLDASGSVLIYATFLGGGGADQGFGIAFDSSGSVYTVGVTSSVDFPVTPGSFDSTQNGGNDAFVAKLNASGSSLVYSTFLGGSGGDEGVDIAIVAAGSAIVSGLTWSSDFPTTPDAYDPAYNSGWDAFVVKLDAAGGDLAYATYLGGGSSDIGQGIAVDSFGSIYVTGQTSSADFPATPGSFDTTHNGGEDGFVAKLNLTSTPPVLGAAGEPNYTSDGLDPEAGTAGVTSFVYKVNFTDADNDTPLAGDPRLHILKGSVEVAASPFTMTAIDPADTMYTDGKLYTFATTLSPCGNDYSYYFTATDSSGTPATNWPSPPPNLPDLPCAPVLSATGEPNYVSDGLDPEIGTMATLFTYRVSYIDADNDPPQAGDAEVHILRGGVEIAGSPFAMTEADPTDTTYTDGKLYTYSTTLSPRGTDFIYYFSASDDTGNVATDWPTPPADAPDVLNGVPTADAGPDQSGRIRNRAVYLNGTGSTDPDGDTLTFSWTQTTGPTVLLTGGDTATPSFTPTVAGTYAFELTVDDGLAGGTDVDTATVTVVNRAPMADAGPDQLGLFRNQVVDLNGTESTDPDGDALTFSWTQTAGPSVVLTGGDTATPSFTPTAAGTYAFELTVNDGFVGGADTDTVTVTVVNRPPVSDAGGPYACVTGETITLNGSGSTDSDGDTLSYQWIVHLTTAVTFSGLQPNFTCPDTDGTFNVTLTVNDSGGLSGTDDTQVSIQPKGVTAADWTWLIIAAIAVIAVLLILFLLIRKKKRGEEEQKPSEIEPSQPPRQS